MAMPCTDYWEATQVQYRSHITVQTNNISWKLIQIRVFLDQIDRQLEAFIFAGGTHCPDYYKVHHSSIMVDSSSSFKIKIERVAHYLNVQRIVNSQVKYRRKQQQYHFFIFFIKTSHQNSNKSWMRPCMDIVFTN